MSVENKIGVKIIGKVNLVNPMRYYNHGDDTWCSLPEYDPKEEELKIMNREINEFEDYNFRRIA